MITGRAVLLGVFTVRVIRAEGFAHAVVDREQESKRCNGRNTWYQQTVSAKNSKHDGPMLQHYHLRCQ